MLVDNRVVVRVPAADRIEVLVVSTVAAAPAEVVSRFVVTGAIVAATQMLPGMSGHYMQIEEGRVVKMQWWEYCHRLSY